MIRRTCLILATFVLAGGCMKPPMSMEPPKKPAPAAEMKNLEKMVGTWNWKGEMVSPTKEEMMKHMPPGSKEPPTEFSGIGKGEMVLGGTALHSIGTFDMGDGQKMTYEEYAWWDAKAGKYRNWSISDWGEVGSGWMTACKDCDGFCSKADAIDAQGNKKRFEGCMKFVNKDTMEWCFTEIGPMGKMTMKGTSKRAN